MTKDSPIRPDRIELLLRVSRAVLDTSERAHLEADVCRVLADELGEGTVVTIACESPAGSAGSTVVAIPGSGEVLVVSRPRLLDAAEVLVVEAIAELVGSGLRRLSVEDRLRTSERRMALAQHIGQMGSYDWEIATDTNTWSDEMYRIYGHEPQSFNASYEKFLSFIHPDDREAVAAVHRRAFETGEPYQMEERIVRPGGEVRILRSNGVVVSDQAGRPVRMVGICMDVTEQRRAEEASRRSGERLYSLVESAPDGVLVVRPDGSIIQANRQATVLFGYDTDELLGMNVDQLLPPEFRGRHASHRASFLDDPKPRPMGSQLDISARRKDGSDVFLDIALGVIHTEDGVLVAAFARDATPRREVEIARRSLVEAKQRRRQALEINDNVVQGLVTALTAIEAGRFDLGAEAVARTLQSARAMMNDLLGEEDELRPGELVRQRAAESHIELPARPEPPVPAPPVPAEPPSRRVVIADDSDDLRFLLRMLLSRSEHFEVVAEATDGAAAIDAARIWHPDVMLLDLAMPNMDGLEAVPAIREISPDTRIVVLSGFDASRMSGAATDAGADAYLEKGASMTDIASVLLQICLRERPAAADQPVRP